MEGEQAESVELAEQVELVCGSGMHTNSLTTLLIHWNYRSSSWKQLSRS